jgi:CrcB protein
MAQMLLVGLGGMIGSVLRLFVATAFQKAISTSFPVGTLAVNLLGCLAIGMFAGLAEAKQWTNLEVRFFVVMGVLGGFTTFSAFGYETFLLLRANAYVFAAASVLANVVVGTVAVVVGWAVAMYFAT